MSVKNNDFNFTFEKGDSKKTSPDKGELKKEIAGAISGRHVAFLFGSGCSSYLDEKGQEQSIPTMKGLAKGYFEQNKNKEKIRNLGLDVEGDKYKNDLECLLSTLYALKLASEIKQESNEKNEEFDEAIRNVKEYIIKRCSSKNKHVIEIYESFYKKLSYRDITLPRPWVFTTNYDLLNEYAMDNLGIPYCNGFTGGLTKRFNPAVFRYALAQQLDIADKKWAAISNYIYFCKLHGSINWVVDKEPNSFWPVVEKEIDVKAAIIYPASTKQEVALSNPYSDLLREFQGRIVREQSILFVCGYSFSDEHINNIIYQGLTIPSFRLIIFAPSDAGGEIEKLRLLKDPRIWFIGSKEKQKGWKAHFFESFVNDFLPEKPSEKANEAIVKVVKELTEQNKGKTE